MTAIWGRWSRLLRDRRGTSAVEFAMLGPLLLTLIFGIVFYGAYFATWIAVTEAASEGARASLGGLYASERQSLASSQVQAVISSYAPFLAPQNLTVSFPASSSTNLFSVRVSYNFATMGLASFAGLIPVPTTQPAITITVQNGGY